MLSIGHRKKKWRIVVAGNQWLTWSGGASIGLGLQLTPDLCERIPWIMALVDYGPRRKRTILNAAHILLQNPRTDVRGESIFICFKRSTCNCFHTFHNKIMYNEYIIIWKCWYRPIDLCIYKHVCMELKYITPRSICNLSIIMWFVARLYLHLH